jgi:hypothetical protein
VGDGIVTNRSASSITVKDKCGVEIEYNVGDWVKSNTSSLKGRILEIFENPLSCRVTDVGGRVWHSLGLNDLEKMTCGEVTEHVLES